ncbi:MAG: S49 family peptidase, partial [Bacteroidales bacterium]|nr:S49 family peptidase [Bacteroidales bacterium]
MKQFFKMAFATVVGLFLFQIIVFVLFLIFIIGMVGLSSTQSVDVKSNTLLVLNLEGNIVERSVDNPFEKYMGNGFGSTKEIGLKTIVDNIKKAKNDENIVGISLKLDKMNASVATLEEIRDALADFKESEKFVYAYGDIYSQGAYYLASVSDKVFFNPEGMFLLQGLSSSILFFKNLLNKMDIEMQVVKVGTY